MYRVVLIHVQSIFFYYFIYYFLSAHDTYLYYTYIYIQYISIRVLCIWRQSTLLYIRVCTCVGRIRPAAVGHYTTPAGRSVNTNKTGSLGGVLLLRTYKHAFVCAPDTHVEEGRRRVWCVVADTHRPIKTQQRRQQYSSSMAKAREWTKARAAREGLTALCPTKVCFSLLSPPSKNQRAGVLQSKGLRIC